MPMRKGPEATISSAEAEGSSCRRRIRTMLPSGCGTERRRSRRSRLCDQPAFQYFRIRPGVQPGPGSTLAGEFDGEQSNQSAKVTVSKLSSTCSSPTQVRKMSWAWWLAYHESGCDVQPGKSETDAIRRGNVRPCFGVRENRKNSKKPAASSYPNPAARSGCKLQATKCG